MSQSLLCPRCYKNPVPNISTLCLECLGSPMVLHKVEPPVLDIEKLKGAMWAQDERERLAGERCGVSYLEHGCDWPDAAAQKILDLRHRVKELEMWQRGEFDTKDDGLFNVRRLRRIIKNLRTALTATYDSLDALNDHGMGPATKLEDINAMLNAERVLEESKDCEAE